MGKFSPGLLRINGIKRIYSKLVEANLTLCHIEFSKIYEVRAEKKPFNKLLINNLEFEDAI